MTKDAQVTVGDPIMLSTTQPGSDLVWDEEGFALSDKTSKSRTVIIESVHGATPIWQHKQDNALAEYQDSHVQEEISDVTHSIYKLFGSYISTALLGKSKKARPVVLDIGCGIGRKQPMYMRRLVNEVKYFGIDAIDINLDRDYPFICSRLEKAAEVEAFHNKFDIFIFGTSLDHFEDIEEVAKAVKKMAAPGAFVIFWIGLHDASLVASEEGADAMRRSFDGAGPLVALWRLFRFTLWKFPRVFSALAWRHAKLNRGENLDDLHFWYFREKDIPGVLANFGEINDISAVPGSNSIFATCCVKMDAS